MASAGEKSVRASDVEVPPALKKPAPRRPRKKKSARRMVKALGALAAVGTTLAARKVKQALRKTTRTAKTKAAITTVAKAAGKAALAAGVTAVVKVTADELRRRRYGTPRLQPAEREDGATGAVMEPRTSQKALAASASRRARHRGSQPRSSFDSRQIERYSESAATTSPKGALTP